jgi:hypothetical protein
MKSVRWALAGVAFVGLLSVVDAESSAASPHSTSGSITPVTLRVKGTPLTDITSTALPLTPAFTAADTDYVWYCNAGNTNESLTLASAGGSITVNSGKSGSTVTLPHIKVVNNQAVVIDAPGGVEYWIRCLPVGFPKLAVTGDSGAPGYYITGSFKSGKDPGFPMVLNSYGTPVWYMTNIGASAQDTELLPNSHTVAWADDGYYRLYNLDTDTLTNVRPPVKPFNGHELYVDTSGNYWMLSYPTVGGFNLAPIGFPQDNEILDCVVQEITPAGKLLWQWNADKYVSPDEANSLAGTNGHPGVVDVYHCNSIDVDPLDPNLILVSMRQAGVYLIDKATNQIVWKLGGTSYPVEDNEPVLTITNDPENTIQGQHDARFQPNGCISLYDDHTKMPSGAARAIEYCIDTTTNTANMDWEYAAPSGDQTTVMGSVRMYDANGTTYDQSGSNFTGPVETVIDWGHGAPTAGFTVINQSGDVLMTVAFPSGIVGNRAEYVPLSALSHGELRASAGLPMPTAP